jgi:GT2 family glycosyltransferase
MNNLKRVTAIIVLYSTTNIIFKCLENLKNIGVIIVDNGNNNEDIIYKLKKNYVFEKYFEPKKNIGFGRANNFALNYVKTEYSLLIEPDVLIDQDSIENLIKTMDIYNDAGVVVPRFKDKNNNIIGWLDDFEENRRIIRADCDKIIQNELSIKSIVGDVCINFSIACILLVNNKIIKKIGLFDKRYFIYWEDFELFRRLRSNRIAAIKSFNSIALHMWKKSTNVNLVSQFIMDTHHHKSAYIYFNEKKSIFHFYKKIFLYTFRFISYLLIFNLKKSLKNIARLYAIYLYLKH